MLPNIKSILLATDLSENSTEAFKHAVMLSRAGDAKIHLLHVVAEVDSGVRTYVAAVMGMLQILSWVVAGALSERSAWLLIVLLTLLWFTSSALFWNAAKKA